MSGSNPRSGPIVGVVDFQGIAGLIDTVLGAAPARLATLLRVLSSANDRLEARVVVEVVVRCRDPLAPLNTLCRDALKTAADLDILLRLPKWHKLEEVIRFGRANAILNLCDMTLKEAKPHTAARRAQISEIRPRVKVAAVKELEHQRETIERIRSTRQAVFPDLFDILETFIATHKKTGSEQRVFKTV